MAWVAWVSWAAWAGNTGPRGQFFVVANLTKTHRNGDRASVCSHRATRPGVGSLQLFFFTFVGADVAKPQ